MSKAVSRLLFLSHIHEEQELALLIKDALEAEFSGFVDVFVSSDGESIPAGSNFLNRIETALTDCVGALYLISPISVRRPWISFELGAVWVRNAISLRGSGPEIPALPVCHSGQDKGSLPSPIGNLNAITGNQSSQLQLAFSSLQRAVGGRGALKTNFDALAANVIAFERAYTLGQALGRALDLLKINVKSFVQFCSEQSVASITLDVSQWDKTSIEILQNLERNELAGHLSIDVKGYGTAMTPSGIYTVSDIMVTFNRSDIIELGTALVRRKN